MPKMVNIRALLGPTEPSLGLLLDLTRPSLGLIGPNYLGLNQPYVGLTWPYWTLLDSTGPYFAYLTTPPQTFYAFRG